MNLSYLGIKFFNFCFFLFKEVFRLVGQPRFHGRFFVVTEMLLTKTVFQVPKKVKIARSKVEAVWRMVRSLPAQKFESLPSHSGRVRPYIIVKEKHRDFDMPRRLFCNAFRSFRRVAQSAPE
ncbi:hypothetical protein TNCV_3540691 [Trichonephila clavipes]|nr:hypothetical protein TNCV_3540691 [Trichonephila clavipes]